MAHLRLIAKAVSEQSPDEACLSAFQRELDYIHRTLHRLGAPGSEVDDLAQDVFLALRGSWTNYDRERPLRPYLFGIAFRIVAAHGRKRRREMPLGVIDADDPRPRAEEVLQTKQARAVLLAALERIPLPRRAVLVMHDLDEVAVEEIAAVLAIPRFTVYSRLRKGRRELEAAVRRSLRRGDVR